MKNIVLIGFMGTGKTAVGRILSKKLGYALVDSDSLIEKEQKMTIAEIFEHCGERAFRDMESASIKRLAEKERLVLATGGGVPLREENMTHLRRKGVIVCLTASPDTILRRTVSHNHRPLLRVKDPLKEIKDLIETRKTYYERADLIINTEGKTPLEVADEIIEAVGGSNGHRGEG
ncbi:MAG: shikimate kinase [Dissulfurispiraceae bacterium]